jgi:hypothetical protein
MARTHRWRRTRRRPFSGESSSRRSTMNCECLLRGIEIVEGVGRPRPIRWLEWLAFWSQVTIAAVCRGSIRDMSLGPFQLRLSTIALYERRSIRRVGRRIESGQLRVVLSLASIAASRPLSRRVARAVIDETVGAQGPEDDPIAVVARGYSGECPIWSRPGTYEHTLRSVVVSLHAACHHAVT